MQPDCETEQGCIVPPVPVEAARVMQTWQRLDALRGIGGGAVIMAQARLTPFEVDLLAAVEGVVQEARQGTSRAAAGEGE